MISSQQIISPFHTPFLDLPERFSSRSEATASISGRFFPRGKTSSQSEKTCIPRARSSSPRNTSSFSRQKTSSPTEESCISRGSSSRSRIHYSTPRRKCFFPRGKSTAKRDGYSTPIPTLLKSFITMFFIINHFNIHY